MKQDWTDEEIAMLGRLWEASTMSAIDIAKQFPGRTSNSVIGKAHRLGLVARAGPNIGKKRKPVQYVGKRPQKAKAQPSTPKAAQPSQPREVTAQKPAAAKTQQVAVSAATSLLQSVLFPKVVPFVRPEELLDDFVTPGTLGRNMCKWPIGDPGTEEFTFCGSKTREVYCSEHKRLAYVPLTNGRERKTVRSSLTAEWT